MPTSVDTCKVGMAMREVPEKYQNALSDLLQNRPSTSGGETDDQICERLYQAGYKISPNTIGRHRSGKCVCFRWQ